MLQTGKEVAERAEAPFTRLLLSMLVVIPSLFLAPYLHHMRRAVNMQ